MNPAVELVVLPSLTFPCAEKKKLTATIREEKWKMFSETRQKLESQQI